MRQRRVLLGNMGSLLLLQGANYLLPLITFPYLVRVLGLGHFGMVAFAHAFAGYFVILTEYGFNLTASRELSIHRNDARRVAEIFSAVMAVKAILLLGAASVFSGLVLLVPKFRPEWPLYSAAFAMVVGSVLFPGWFFQGMERMRYATLTNIGSKAAAAASIFLLVRDREDYVLAALLQSTGFVVAGVWSLVLVRRTFGIRWVAPGARAVRAAFRDGWHVFLSQASLSLFSNTNVFILGLFAPAAVVGRFAVAEKIVRAVVGLSVPVSGAIYPRVSLLFERSRGTALAFLRKVAVQGGLVFLAASVLLLSGAEFAVLAVTGEADAATVLLVRVMSVLPLTIFIDNIYGTQILLNIDGKKEFMEAVTLAGAFSILASLVVVPLLGALGSALVFTATELLVLTLMVRSVHGFGIKLHLAYR
jgi:PST family polysaccharide transporter